MMLVGADLRVVLTSIHIPLKEAVANLTKDAIVAAGLAAAQALSRDFGIARPRIALAGLNPHAGEGGALGREEIEIVTPAAVALRARGIDVTDPLPPDTMFHERARRRYDAVLCLYHDQALIPLKTIAFDTGVNVTLGLPFVRTSPDHGTAFDIAGQGHRQLRQPGGGPAPRRRTFRPPRRLRPPRGGRLSEMTALAALPPLRDVIARHELRAKRSLGQNFLLDLNLTAKIARAAGDLTQGTVIEIGPGPGGLTRALLSAGARKVIAIERDERCVAALGDVVAASDGRLEILSADALETPVHMLGDAPRRVVANLPYNIATPLLLGWLAHARDFAGFTLMFQKEVALRLAAPPGDDDYGRLSIAAQWRAEVQAALRYRSARLHPAAQDRLQRGRADAARPAALRGRSQDPGAGDGRRVRPAPQDAAREFEVAGCR